MTRTTPLHLDLVPIETKPGRRGFQLRCPACHRWANHLLVLGDGVLVCRRCRPALGEETR
jgi:hypothetical protein